MFGTDYMEGLYAGRRISYSQRLDIFLCRIEKWPIPTRCSRSKLLRLSTRNIADPCVLCLFWSWLYHDRAGVAKPSFHGRNLYFTNPTVKPNVL